MITPTVSSLRAWLWLGWALALAAAIGWGEWQRSNAQEAHARMLQQERDQAQAVHDALAAALAKQTKRMRALEDVNREGLATLAQVRRDAAAADAARAGVLDYVADLEARAGNCDTGTADGRQAAAEAARMLADLQRRADERAGILAAFADEAHAAGEACERAYESLTTEERPSP